MLDKLKALNIDRIDIEDAIELITFGRLAQTTYTSYEVPAPAWLNDAIGTLDGEIKRRRRDMLESRRKELLARQAALKSREEKRAEADAELARLNVALGITPSA